MSGAFSAVATPPDMAGLLVTIFLVVVVLASVAIAATFDLDD